MTLQEGHRVTYTEDAERLDVEDLGRRITRIHGALAHRIWNVLQRERADGTSAFGYNCYGTAAYVSGQTNTLEWVYGMDTIGDVTMLDAKHEPPTERPTVGQFHSRHPEMIAGIDVPPYGPVHAFVVVGEDRNPLLFEKNHKAKSGFQTWNDAVPMALRSFEAPVCISHAPLAEFVKQPMLVRRRTDLLSA